VIAAAFSKGQSIFFDSSRRRGQGEKGLSIVRTTKKLGKSNKIVPGEPECDKLFPVERSKGGTRGEQGQIGGVFG